MRRLADYISDDNLRRKLRRAAVYSFLVRECLSLNIDTLRNIERLWDLDEEEVFQLGIVSCPSKVGNIIAAGACANKFGELFDIPGFYRCNECWWLDLDGWLSQRGVIVPVRDSQSPNLIIGLRIFRNTGDKRPFMLHVRSRKASAA